MRFLGMGETGPGGGGDAGSVGDFLGEFLAPLKLGGCGTWAAASDTSFGQGICNAGDKRGFRAGNDEVDFLLDRKAQDAGDIRGAEIYIFSQRGGAWIARGSKELGEQRTLHDGPGQRMLASAGTDDQHAHVKPLCEPGCLYHTLLA